MLRDLKILQRAAVVAIVSAAPMMLAAAEQATITEASIDWASAEAAAMQTAAPRKSGDICLSGAARQRGADRTAGDVVWRGGQPLGAGVCQSGQRLCRLLHPRRHSDFHFGIKIRGSGQRCADVAS